MRSNEQIGFFLNRAHYALIELVQIKLRESGLDEFVKPGILVTERSLFRTLSQHISTAIEAQRKHHMLDDRQHALGLSRQESEFAATLTARQSLHSVESRELARKIARRFFGDLRAAGFETKHIILVATEILDSVKEALRKAGRKQKVPGAGIQAALVPGGH